MLKLLAYRKSRTALEQNSFIKLIDIGVILLEKQISARLYSLTNLS